MSTLGEETAPQTLTSNVDISLKENCESECETTRDSGVDTLDSSSITLPKSSGSEILPRDCANLADDSATISESSPISASSTSLTPELNDTTEDLGDYDDIALFKKKNKDKENPNHHDLNGDSENEGKNSENVINDGCKTLFNDSTSNTSSDDIKNSEFNLDLRGIQLEKSSQVLASSIISLNEENCLGNSRPSLLKAQYSRSAENISFTAPEIPSVSSTDNLNTEQILSEFSNKKIKVQATQKLTPETADRYPRLPKELLNQDLGSIVKNVHGIFSSVSGSLKNAYNSTHRTATAKPLPKTLPSSKIMNDIFEEEMPAVTQENGIDKQDIQESEPNNLSNVETEDLKSEVLKLQVEAFERLLAEQRKEMTVLRDRVRQQTEELQERDQTFKDLEAKMDLMRKRTETAEREKNAAVMRYASSECAVIDARKAADTAAKAERAATAEMELLNGKLKSAHAEKQRICQLYDDKCHELQTSDREVSKLREELKELEGRLKWTQSKLRTEIDAYKECSERAERLTQQVSQLEACREAAAAAAPDALRARQLESELKESQAALILSRHEADELERRVTSLAQELATCASDRDNALGALARTNAEVEELREAKARLEEEAASLACLAARAALADSLTTELERECTRVRTLESSLTSLRAAHATCASRERAALHHAELVTASHVAARSHATALQQKAQALEADNTSLRAQQAAMEAEVSRLQAALTDESERRNRENRQLARKVAELTEELADVKQKLEWEIGENGVLKKKHSSVVKELNRELQRALKRCDQLEAKIPQPESDDNRTGSVSSLSSSEHAPASDERLQNGHATDALPDIQARPPDRQALIERIVSLQRALARRSERTDFLEEHSKQLTAELRDKSRLLRRMLCATPCGALASQTSDQHKSDMARLGGGAMAAVWGGDSSGMTLELSLQINNKLQAVLEDALLKNITLKENMDTLGEEIARLKGQTKTDTK